MGKGWILLHRKLQDNALWKSTEPFDRRSAWIDLLFLANHCDAKELYKGQFVCRERGKIYCSYYWLAKRWRWDRRKVVRYLMALESDGMCHTLSTSNGTTITIVNYDKYQFSGTSDGTSDCTTDGTTDGTTHGTHKKNVERIKKNVVINKGNNSRPKANSLEGWTLEEKLKSFRGEA